jgi:hypothetical protein
MSEEKKVRRILHFKFTLPSKDAAQFFAMMKNMSPISTIFGDMHMHFLQNADDPARIIQVVEYDAPESMEARRQSMASDPRVQAYLQAWRTMAPSVEMDVYREIEI